MLWILATFKYSEHYSCHLESVCHLCKPCFLVAAFRAFYVQFMSKLHEVSSDSQGIISLCALFEHLVSTTTMDSNSFWRYYIVWVLHVICLALGVYLLAILPPVDLYLISENSIRKNQVRWTGFLVYFELDFYCLYSLQKSISKLIFAG